MRGIAQPTDWPDWPGFKPKNQASKKSSNCLLDTKADCTKVPCPFGKQQSFGPKCPGCIPLGSGKKDGCSAWPILEGPAALGHLSSDSD